MQNTICILKMLVLIQTALAAKRIWLWTGTIHNKRTVVSNRCTAYAETLQ